MEIELPDGTVLEAPDGADASAVAKNYLAKQGTSAPEPSAGQKLIDIAHRFAQGTESLVSGPLQLGANIGTAVNRHVVAPVQEALGFHEGAAHTRNTANVVAGAINSELQQQAADSQAAQAAAGNGTVDLAGLAGAIVPAVLTGGASATAAARPLLQRVGLGAATGTGWGATAPVTTGSEGFWGQKGKQAGAGAVLGTAAPLAAAVLAKAGTGIRDIYDVMSGSETSVDRLKRAYYKRLVGEKNLPAVENSLWTADELVPGGRPTAAEALSTSPAGTAIQAQQRVTAATPGGPSADFNARLYAQAVARKSAEMERDAVTAPMRQAALGAATNIDRPALATDIAGIVNAPGTQAVTPARTFLTRISKDINNADSADKLYSVRKYIGDLIDKRVESPNNVAQYAGTQLMAMKKAIDTAIEKGGAGSSWRDYLSEYAKRSQAVANSEERAAAMYKPLQRTNVAGAANIAESSGGHLPNLLSRTAMVANWLAKAARSNIEPKIDASMAQDFLNPQIMAEVLKRATPQQRGLLSRAVQNLTTVGAPVAAGRGAGG